MIIVQRPNTQSCTMDIFSPPVLILSLLLPPSLLLVDLFLLFAGRNKLSWKLPPGPKKLPIIGNLHQLMSRLPHRSLHHLSKEHGPLMTVYMGSNRTLVVNSTKFAEEIMKTQDLAFANRPEIFAMKLHSYGGKDIAFAPYGDDWRDSRKLCILEFLSMKKVQSFQSLREEELCDLLHFITQSTAAGEGVNLSQLVSSMTTNLICRVTMGEKHALGDHSKSRLIGIVKEMEALAFSFFFSDQIPALGMLDSLTGMKKRVEKNFRDMDSFLNEIIEKHMRRKDDDGAFQSRDTLDRLLEIQEEGNERVPLSMERIKGILMNAIIAGTDTSSTVIIWAMAELMRNPEIMARAQEEVRLLAAGKERVESADVDKLPYLKSVAKETLRLHSPVPLSVAQECREHTKVCGYDVPKGTRVSVNTWSIMRDPNHWPNPEEFQPERFLHRDLDYGGQHFEFIPFGSGRRICPGINFGMAIVNLTLANLLYGFDWEMPSGTKEIDMSETLGITLHKKKDLILVAHPPSLSAVM